MKCKTVQLSPEVSIAYVGPDLESGPLPGLFYFSLSAEDSLGLDPFNQPAAFLSSYPLRVFSMTLPGHGGELLPTRAMEFWANALEKGHDIIGQFTDHVVFAIDELLRQRILIPNQIGAAGLSRGGLIALHAAAKILDIQFILGFAPVTRLAYLKEFRHLEHNHLVQSLAADSLIPRLVGRKFRFYIGNYDHCVGTDVCFQFIHALAGATYQQRIRSPQVELIISPSIGHLGHGTSTKIFHQGARWMLEQLEVAYA